MTEEQLERLKKESVFKVPDGYFDTFTERMMSKIPVATASVHRQNKWRRMLSAAACLAVIIVGASFFFFKGADRQSDSTQTVRMADNAPATMTTEEIQTVADNIMVDDDELYAYMVGF